MTPQKLDISDLDVTTFTPDDEEMTLFLYMGNQMACTGCDSGCGIMGGTYGDCY